jgi:hypothetical protein
MLTCYRSQDDGLEQFHLGLGAANIGIMFVRKAALPLVDEWNKVLDKDEKIWDQNAFNDLFRRGVGKELPNRLFMAYDVRSCSSLCRLSVQLTLSTAQGTLRVGILPVATFASGHTFFVQRLHEKLKLKPYVVHATFQFSGTDGKRHRMREAMLWDVDPPEYYDPPGGFLVFEADVPRALLDSSNSKDGHFALVNHQIKQVRDALALAQALGRALVMPKLYCGWDRWWAPHSGRIPNSLLDLPYLCPMVRLVAHVHVGEAQRALAGPCVRPRGVAPVQASGRVRSRHRIPRVQRPAKPAHVTGAMCHDIC